jgi:hypothetical protein
VLVHVGDADAEFRTIAAKRANQFRLITRGKNKIADAGVAQLLYDPLQDRLLSHRHRGFGMENVSGRSRVPIPPARMIAFI